MRWVLRANTQTLKKDRGNEGNQVSSAVEKLTSFLMLLVDAHGLLGTVFSEDEVREVCSRESGLLTSGGKITADSWSASFSSAFKTLLASYGRKLELFIQKLVPEVIKRSVVLKSLAEGGDRLELSQIKKIEVSMRVAAAQPSGEGAKSNLQDIIISYFQDAFGAKGGNLNKEHYKSLLRNIPFQISCSISLTCEALSEGDFFDANIDVTYTFPVELKFEGVPFTYAGVEDLQRRVDDFLLNFLPHTWGEYFAAHLFRQDSLALLYNQYALPQSFLWNFEDIVKSFMYNAVLLLCGEVPKWFRDFLKDAHISVRPTGDSRDIDENVDAPQLESFHRFKEQIRRADTLFFTIRVVYRGNFSCFFFRFAISWLARKLAVIVGITPPGSPLTRPHHFSHLLSLGHVLEADANISHTFVYTEVDIPPNLTVENIPILLRKVLTAMARSGDVLEIFLGALPSLAGNYLEEEGGHPFYRLRSNLSFQASGNIYTVRGYTNNATIVYSGSRVLGGFSEVIVRLSDIKYEEVRSAPVGSVNWSERLPRNLNLVYFLKRIEPRHASLEIMATFSLEKVEGDAKVRHFATQREVTINILLDDAVIAAGEFYESICMQMKSEVENLLSSYVKYVIEQEEKVK